MLELESYNLAKQCHLALPAQLEIQIPTLAAQKKARHGKAGNNRHYPLLSDNGPPDKGRVPNCMIK